MRTIEKTVYLFPELSDKAKERARDWFRASLDHDDWHESTYEDADTIAKILGIEIDRKPVKLMGGSTRYDPTIWFSGFSSQGDGACFEGQYRYATKAPKKIRAHAPKDETLHAIADELQALQRRHGYRLEARVKHRGHYYHDLCTVIDVADARTGDDAPDDAAVELRELLRRFMKWIYRQLESEYDYQMSDETVDGNIIANEYEFDATGKRCG